MAPGRVNLIGEHTDYNQGFVLPFAIEDGVYVAASLASDGEIRVFSQQYGKAASTSTSRYRGAGSPIRPRRFEPWPRPASSSPAWRSSWTARFRSARSCARP
jgi:galactokinase